MAYLSDVDCSGESDVLFNSDQYNVFEIAQKYVGGKSNSPVWYTLLLAPHAYHSTDSMQSQEDDG